MTLDFLKKFNLKIIIIINNKIIINRFQKI